MLLIEKFLQGKNTDPFLCEDVIVTSPDFVAVIDGASDRTGVLYDGVLGGRFAAKSVARSFSILPASIGMGAAVDLINRRLNEDLLAAGKSIELPPVAVFVAYSRRSKEVWRLGDGSWRSRGHEYLGSKKIDEINTSARVALVKAFLADGSSVEELRAKDPGWAMVLPLLQRQHLFQNVEREDDLAYGAIDGRPVPDRFFERWPVASGSEIVLSSDGYPRLFMTLGETEDYLAQCLKKDPLCVEAHPSIHRWIPGHYSFDDRAYVRLTA